MPATKPLSTKSPLVWRATLHPSKLFRTLYFSALLISVAALTQCPIEWFYRTALMLITGAGGVLIFMSTTQAQHLAFFDDQSWQFDDGACSYTGKLSSGSYRSMLVVVVAIKPDNGWTRHAVIWRDSVDPTIFSALHIRLALHTPDS